MGKPHYEDYANRAMRFYARHAEDPAARLSECSLADMLSWKACELVFREDCTPTERDVALAFYRSSGFPANTVRSISAEQHIQENQIWQILTKITRMFAVRRGLI